MKSRYKAKVRRLLVVGLLDARLAEAEHLRARQRHEYRGVGRQDELGVTLLPVLRQQTQQIELAGRRKCRLRLVQAGTAPESGTGP